MKATAQQIVEIIGPCTGDISNCEVFRSAFALREASADNERAQRLRTELAKVACEQCASAYLID